jgi:hypothetical protein
MSLTMLTGGHTLAAMSMDVTEMARLGGKASAANLTAEQRSRKARKAARARWRKQRKPTKTPRCQ